MMSPRDPLQSLLASADRQFQTDDTVAASSRPISIVELQLRSGQRHLRRRLTTAVVAVFGVAAALAWSRGLDIQGPKADHTKLAAGPITSSLSVPVDKPHDASAAQRSLAALQREAAAALQTAKAMEHDLERAALRKEYRALLRRSPLVEPRSTLERAAQFRLHLAAELDRKFGGTELARREYRQIVEQFPETKSAATAQQRLADARSKS